MQALTGVPEWRVAEIVGERDGFGEILIKAQLPRYRAGDLRHLQRMGEPIAIVIALVHHKHLRLVGETAEGGRMQDSVAVARELSTRVTASRAFGDAPLEGESVVRQRPPPSGGACQSGLGRVGKPAKVRLLLVLTQFARTRAPAGTYDVALGSPLDQPVCA